ncbi:MAG: MATE family efflux transporter [Candidatus Marinimicrobia bacterium]|nr:MATE family efflux transporter [Candidatus Neomarinimicrobiota bacterium]
MLALPIIASNLSRVVMNMADVAMVGQLGAPALAATGLGSMLVWAVVSFGISLRTATQTVASRRLGQKKYLECGTAMHNGHLLAFLYGVPAAAAGYFFAKQFVPFFISETTVTRLCIDYTSVAFLSVFFSAFGFVFQGFYTGVEKTSVHMKVTVTANLLNVYLNAGLIYGKEGVQSFFKSIELVDVSWVGELWSWYDFPELGVKGAATATLISSAWLAVHYLFYLLKPAIYKKFHIFSFTLNWKMLKRQITLAVPQGSQQMIVMIGFVLFFKIVGIIGVAELAAVEIVFTILQSSFMPAIGVGQACATLVGKYMGEEKTEKAETSIVESVRWSFLIMGSVGVMFLFIPQYIIPIFTNDPRVMEIGVYALRIAALVQFADAVGLTLWFALSGAGNTFFPAVVEAVIVWGFFLPASYVSGLVLGFGFMGPWIAFVVYIVLFAIIMFWKIRKGDWKKIIV